MRMHLIDLLQRSWPLVTIPLFLIATIRQGYTKSPTLKKSTSIEEIHPCKNQSLSREQEQNNPGSGAYSPAKLHTLQQILAELQKSSSVLLGEKCFNPS